jgi:ABC-type antimicrobial peptide transport system permease subunit
LAVRTALGAGRMRIIRQFLAESILLAILGGTAGLILARCALSLVIRIGSQAIPRIAETRMDGWVLAFTLAISLAIIRMPTLLAGESASDTISPMPKLKMDRSILEPEGIPTALISAIRHALSEVNGQLVLYRPRTMDEIISGSLAQRRFSMILLGVFALLALVMSCVGIYGVISFLAGQRTHEIGIRMALGANRRDMLRMVLEKGMCCNLGRVIW